MEEASPVERTISGRARLVRESRSRVDAGMVAVESGFNV